MYPDGTTGMHSYIEARKTGETIVPFGAQMWVKKNLLDPITKEDIEEYDAFGKAHGEPTHPELFQYMLDEYNGYMPITIHGIPEGTPTPSQKPLWTIECTDPKLFWLSSYLETNFQRGVWYPTTIASNDRKNYLALKAFYNVGADTNDLLPFVLHDFAGRGVSSDETAQIGGAAHLVYFMGSDTVAGVRAANFYYNTAMSAFSVVASEHSVQCSFGPDGQSEYLEKVLKFAKPGAIVSIVLDGYDVMRESLRLCTEFHDLIVESGAKVVFRPDSGDFMAIIPQILAMQEKYFGFKINSKGKKVINNVGLIQGDGICHETMVDILYRVTSLGYSPEVVVFGSGGKLLQGVMRDDYGFAQKASAVLINGVWRDVFKAPITDPGKRSKAGRLTSPDMVKIYGMESGKGKLFVDDTLAVIRQRAFA
jgi:nicotinamide phosphoribosyltransferase